MIRLPRHRFLRAFGLRGSLTGAIGAALLTSTALAPLPLLAQQPAVPADPRTTDAPIDFEADQITYNRETGDVTATGQVMLSRDGYVLRAGQVRYNEKTGSAVAEGAVELTFPTGEVVHAPRMVLEERLKEAFIADFRLILNDGAQLAAKSGEHSDASGQTTLRRAVYSPCDVCADDEDTPVWQLKAVKVVHDRAKQRLIYRNASLEVLGVPIFWTPYFSHPDPTVDRASGFLPIDINARDELGLVLSTPYHFVIDQSQDVTLTPIFTTLEGIVVGSEYRKHIGWGEYKVGGSITYTDINDDDGNDTGEQEIRGHFNTSGYLQHGAGWRSTFDINVASDDTYLRRYNFSNVDTLVSEYALQNFFDQSFLSVRTLGFQGLRLEDDQGLTPFALPLISGEYVAPIQPLGGVWTLGGSAAALTRFDGLDTRRVSLYTNWRKRWVLPRGVLFALDGLVRGDFYDVSDADEPDEVLFSGTGGTTFRGVTRLTGELSWPLIKATAGGSHVIEPRIHFTLAPEAGSIDDLVNEDSRAFELSDLNIFSSERAPGFDLVEEGSRVTYGLSWDYTGENWSTSVFVGQAFRITGADDQFDPGLGLTGDVSDLVGRTSIAYKNWLEFSHRYRVDESSLAIRRNEMNVKVGNRAESFFQVGYLKLDRDLPFVNREDREELRAYAAVRLNERWRLTGSAIQDLTSGFDGVVYTGGVVYGDECFDFSLEVRRTFTEDRDVEPGTNVRIRFRLKNLG